MPSPAVALAAASMSSKDSPGMNFDTARRTNGSFVPLARIHWLSEIFNRAVRAMLMRTLILSFGLRDRYRRLLGRGRERVQRSNSQQLRPDRAHDHDDRKRREAAADDRQRRAEQRRGGAAFERAELVREAD